MPNGFHVERVDCCMCDATGRVPKFVFWSKDCSVCEGTGKRRILISEKLSPADHEMVMISAITGMNFSRAPSFLNSILGGIF